MVCRTMQLRFLKLGTVLTYAFNRPFRLIGQRLCTLDIHIIVQNNVSSTPSPTCMVWMAIGEICNVVWIGKLSHTRVDIEMMVDTSFCLRYAGCNFPTFLRKFRFFVVLFINLKKYLELNFCTCSVFISACGKILFFHAALLTEAQFTEGLIDRRPNKLQSAGPLHLVQ